MQNQNPSFINKQEIKQSFIFHHVQKNENERLPSEIIFCNCGNVISKDEYDKKQDNKNKETELIVEDFNPYEDIDLESILRKTTKGVNLTCSQCQKNFSQRENYSLMYSTNQYFLESYKFIEDENCLTLYKIKVSACPNIKDNKQLEIDIPQSFIRLDKNDKKLYFLDFVNKSNQNPEQIEFNLDKCFKIVKRFLENSGEAEITNNLLEIHLFINRLANFVSDSKNINIVDELMKQMIGRAGMDILTKVVSIFCGIVCYSNLSTIALTKGTAFLYDILNECKLPNPKILSDNNITSPLNIFNFLINNTNKDIQDSIDSYDPEKVGYLFKSKSGQEMNFSYENIARIDSHQTQVKVDNGLFVKDEIINKAVSPYIFNKIKKFNEYKTLIRYVKFIQYKELIEVVMKYDVELLINLYELIEFRDGVNRARINQFINLMISYAKRYKLIELNGTQNTSFSEDVEFVRDKFIDKEVEEQKQKKYTEKDIEYIELDFNVVKNFRFTIYDDCLRMINSLNWNPEKEFYKIKTMTELEEYHDKLTTHFNLLNNTEKNVKFVNFVNKYKYLEEYDGVLNFQLIKSPDQLLREAEDMHNCAGSYVSRIAEEQYLLFIVQDLSPERKKQEDVKFMFGLKVTKYGIEFDQVKSICNRQGSDRFKTQIMKYLEDKDISYKELADLRLTTSHKPLESEDFLF